MKFLGNEMYVEVGELWDDLLNIVCVIGEVYKVCNIIEINI